MDDGEDFKSFWGEAALPTGAVKDRFCEGVFNFLDGSRDAGLGDAENFGGFAEVAGFGKKGDGAEVVDGEAVNAIHRI